MGADDDIYLALFYLLENLLGSRCTTCAAQVLNGAWELFQALPECEVMLVGEYRCGYKYRNLLAVSGCLEGRAYRNLGLAEPDISAYETVHRTPALHVALDVSGGLQLVGRVLIDETCLKFRLQVAVGRKCEPLFPVAL